MPNKKPSSIAWSMVHVVFPLSPFFFEGVIRLVASGNIISWTTFSSSTLAMSVGLLCLFVSQSILTRTPTIPSSEENERIAGIVNLFNMFAIMSFVFFAVIVLLTALFERFAFNEMQTIKSTFDAIVIVGAFFPISFTFVAQRSFKLRTTL